MVGPASEANWLTGLDFAITDAPAAGGSASAGAPASSVGSSGGKFSLSIEEAQSMLTVAKRVRDSLQKMSPTAEGLLQVRPPTDDPGSTGYSQLLVGNANGGAFHYGATQVAAELKYATDLVTKLHDALAKVGAADEASTAAVKAAASGSQSEGLL